MKINYTILLLTVGFLGVCGTTTDAETFNGDDKVKKTPAFYLGPPVDEKSKNSVSTQEIYVDEKHQNSASVHGDDKTKKSPAFVIEQPVDEEPQNSMSILPMPHEPQNSISILSMPHETQNNLSILPMPYETKNNVFIQERRVDEESQNSISIHGDDTVKKAPSFVIEQPVDEELQNSISILQMPHEPQNSLSILPMPYETKNNVFIQERRVDEESQNSISIHGDDTVKKAPVFFIGQPVDEEPQNSMSILQMPHEPQNSISILSMPYETQTLIANSSESVKEQSANASIVSLSEVAELVTNYHPSIAHAKASAKGQEDMIDVAEAGYYPQISAGVNMGHDRNASGGNSTNSRTMSIEVQQTIYDFGKTSSQVKGATLGFEGANTQAAITTEELVYTATSTLIDVARQKKLLELSKEHIAQMSSLVKLVSERHRGGATNLSDVLHAKSRLDEEKSTQLYIESLYDSQLKKLRILTGMPSISGVKLTELPLAFKTSCEKPIVWDEVPRYLLADLESKRAETEFDLAKAEQMPSIYVTGRGSRYLNGPDNYRSRHESSVSLNVSMPVYQGGSLSARKRAYAEYALAASFRKEQVRLEVEDSLSVANINLSNMQSSRGLLEDRVKNLAGTRSLYRMQYFDLGTRSLIELLNSEQEYHNSRQIVENNHFDILSTQISCAYHHGKLNEYFQVNGSSSIEVE